MKLLVLGAGATLAEALGLGNSPERCPPVIGNFARKTWSNYTPHPLLEAYLAQLGKHDIGTDPRELFYELEEQGVTNIEKFMQYAWENRDGDFQVSDTPPRGYISGLRIVEPSRDAAASNEVQSFWDNLLYHGIGSPLQLRMIQNFSENGGWRDLKLSKAVANRLAPDDVVLNLNYDTVFELALNQIGRGFAYSPNRVTGDKLLVVKPHGSLNLVANDKAFAFGPPDWLGMPQPHGYRSYSGLIPPRLNKSYAQHPIAQMILEPVRDLKPRTIVMWGVGLTESDEDLVTLYRGWAAHTEAVDVINPDMSVSAKVADLIKCEVRSFPSVEDWIGANGASA